MHCRALCSGIHKIGSMKPSSQAERVFRSNEDLSVYISKQGLSRALCSWFSPHLKFSTSATRIDQIQIHS
jgi:hypothetical protein